MKYSNEIIKFTLGEVYEENMSVLAGKKKRIDFSNVAKMVNDMFYEGAKRFSYKDVERIFARFTTTSYHGVQKRGWASHD